MKAVLLTLLATCLIQLGYFIWKVTVKDLPRLGEVKVIPAVLGFVTNGPWMFGMALRLSGLALFIKATSFGDLSLIQPLMASGDIIFVLLVCVFLHERLTTYEWIGIFLTFLGSVAISFEAKALDHVTINTLYMQMFFVFSVLVIGAFVVLRKHLQQSEVFWGIAVGTAFGVAAVLIKMMTAHLSLIGKDVTATTVLLNPILALIITANITGLAFLQLAFQNARAAIVFPIQIAVTIIISVLAGMYLFAENVSLYRLGCIIVIILGAALLQYAAQIKKSTV